MTDTFMDPSVCLVGTNAVAYIDTGITRPIRIPPRRVVPGRKQIMLASMSSLKCLTA